MNFLWYTTSLKNGIDSYLQRTQAEMETLSEFLISFYNQNKGHTIQVLFCADRVCIAPDKLQNNSVE